MCIRDRVTTIYNIADTFFIGQLHNTAMIAATTVAMPIMMLTHAFGESIGVSAGSYISRQLGAGHRDQVSRIVQTTMTLVVLISIVLPILFITFLGPLLGMFGAEGDVTTVSYTHLTTVELINAGYDVVIIDNLVNSCKGVIDRIEKITGKRPRFYENDLLDKAAVEKVFEENEIEAVIHFAGLKAVGESVTIPLTYYHNNLTGTLILCEVMKAHNCKKIVFSSSATAVSYTHLDVYKRQI